MLVRMMVFCLAISFWTRSRSSSKPNGAAFFLVHHQSENAMRELPKLFVCSSYLQHNLTSDLLPTNWFLACNNTKFYIKMCIFIRLLTVVERNFVEQSGIPCKHKCWIKPSFNIFQHSTVVEWMLHRLVEGMRIIGEGMRIGWGTDSDKGAGCDSTRHIQFRNEADGRLKFSWREMIAENSFAELKFFGQNYQN